MGQIERRTFKAEIRKAGDGRKIRGIAVVFNQLSENLGGYREQIDPAAFDGCDVADVRCLFNHDESMVLGRTVSNTLTITRDSYGMHFECDPADTTYSRDLAACMERGDIDQCSFGFVVAPDGAEWSKDPATGGDIRTVKKIARLRDLSVVTFPAYPQTSSELRTSAEILSERPASPPPPVSNRGASARLDLLRREIELTYHAPCNRAEDAHGTN